MSKNNKGKIYLIPTPLSETHTDVLPESALKIVRELKYFIVEKAKTARRFLKAYQTNIAFDDMVLFEINKRTLPEEIPRFLDPAAEGQSIGILSEAGCPGIADPGTEVVRLAHKRGLEVIPLGGASSIVMALMASGLNGQQFAFSAYLPVKSGERIRQLKSLEQRSKQFKQTQIFMETPYRNNALLQDAGKALSPHLHFCIASDITGPDQLIKTKTIAQWKKQGWPDLHKKPTIFLMGN